MDRTPTLRIASDAETEAGENNVVAEASETEAKAESRPAAAPPTPSTNAPRRKRSLVRPILFSALPIALVVGGYGYVTGGQIMSTENAYIQADMLGVTTDVAGLVQEIGVHDNEQVKAGQVLFKLDPAPFRINLDAAKAQLGLQRNQIENLKASYQRSLAEITQAEADLPFYQDQFDRQNTLVRNGSASRTALDQARHDLEVARQKVAVAKSEAAATLAQLGGKPDQAVEDNPLYLQAKAQIEKAERDLDHTTVKAPFDGIVTNVKALQVGSYLQASQQAFSLVSTTHLWIAANPKETELTYVKPGQTAEIHVDSYPGVVWKGRVASISPASGSSFSLLPAQNTTGNWVKVVQRIPMLVGIDGVDGQPPLRVGMSTVVDVDTGHARGLPDFVTSLLKWTGRS